MPLDPAHRKHVQQYVDLGDRSQEPVFVGRERHFDLVERTVERVVNGAPKGATLCFPGPPGIGKTAFLRALRERCDRRLRAGRRGPLLVDMPVELLHLSQQHKFAAEVLAAGERAHPKAEGPNWAAQTLGRLAQSKLTIAPPLSGVKVEVPLRSADAPHQADWATAHRILQELPNCTALLLCVDECQHLKGEDGMPGGKCDLISRLHRNASLAWQAKPIIPVLAGHVQLAEVIDASVSTRLTRGHLAPLKRLSMEDSFKYAIGTIEHLNLEGARDEKERLAKWVADESAGWPHHLRNAMSDWAGGHLAADSPRLADVDGAAVALSWRQARINYYEGRTPKDLHSFESCFLQLAERLKSPPHITSGHLLRKVATAILDSAEEIDAGWLEESRQNGRAPQNEMLGQLKAKGLIGQCHPDDDRWEVPIPSLLAYLETWDYQPESPPPVGLATEADGPSPA